MLLTGCSITQITSLCKLEAVSWHKNKAEFAHKCDFELETRGKTC